MTFCVWLLSLSNMILRFIDIIARTSALLLSWLNNISLYSCATFCLSIYSSISSLVAQLVKNLPAMWETWVPSLVWEDPLEKGKATHSSILAWRIPWTMIAKSQPRLSEFRFHCHFRAIVNSTAIDI